MIKLKDLIYENIKDALKELDLEIERLYQLYKDSDYKDESLKKQIDDLGVKRNQLRDADPHEGGKHRFLKHHHTGNIPSYSYSRYEEEGGLSWLGTIDKFPILLDKGKFGPYEVEFRQRNEKNKYVKKDEHGEHIRLPNGDLVYLSDDEMKAEELPVNDETVVAFVDGKPIGMSANEFGAVGVFVEKKYQRLGIGTELLEKHIELRPRFKKGIGKIGQMTPAGLNMTAKYYEKMSKKYGNSWYEKWKEK